MKWWGVFLLGGGLGLMIGEGVGEAAALPGLVVAVLGLSLLIFGRRKGSRDGTRDLVGDAMAARPSAPGERPSFAHLGTRVEQILSLAEEQAADHVGRAKAEAAEILARARADADRIVTRGAADRTEPNENPSH